MAVTLSPDENAKQTAADESSKSDQISDKQANIASSNSDVTTDDDVTDSNDVAGNDEVATGDDAIASVDDVTGDKPTVQTTNNQQDRESATGNPTQETTPSPPMKTSRSVAHDTSDVTTSTSVSEQTTKPSDVVQDKSTRLDMKVSTNKDFNSPRTTRSTEESSQASDKPGEQSQPSENSNSTTFNVSVVDAWPSAVTEGLGQVTGLAVDSAGRLFVFHRSERTWDYE